MGAAILQVPELEIGEDDAKKLGDALANVSAVYAVEIDPKKLAWLDLTRVAGMIYGPMAVSIYLRNKMVRQASPPPPRQQQPPPKSSSGETPVKMPPGFDPTAIKPMGNA